MGYRIHKELPNESEENPLREDEKALKLYIPAVYCI
jgi:hypothetical protein